jgi:hypothetical protein
MVPLNALTSVIRMVLISISTLRSTLQYANHIATSIPMLISITLLFATLDVLHNFSLEWILKAATKIVVNSITLKKDPFVSKIANLLELQFILLTIVAVKDAHHVFYHSNQVALAVTPPSPYKLMD